MARFRHPPVSAYAPIATELFLRVRVLINQSNGLKKKICRPFSKNGQII